MVEEQVDQEIEKARKDAKDLKELTTHPGWKILEQMLDNQINRITNEVMLSPRSNQQKEYEYEFLKGQAAGLRIAKTLAYTEFETLEAVVGAKDGPDHSDSD